MDNTIDLNESSPGEERGVERGGAGGGGGTLSNQQYSSNSSVGSRSGRSRKFRYRGRMLTVKAMDQLPPVNENHHHSSGESDFYGNKRSRLGSPFLMPFDASSRQTMYISITAFLVYLFIGTLTYTLWIPSWNVVDSMYFTVATFTTVGYGDIVPMNDGQRAFTLFFVILGTFLAAGIFFGYLFHHMYNSFEEISKEAKAMTSDYFINRLDHAQPDEGGNVSMIMMVQQDEEPFWTELCRTFTKTVPLLCALIVPPLIMGYYEDWNVLSSFYYTVATATTVGYGDIAPKNTWMRLIAVFYLPICIYVMARTFAKLTAVYLRHKARAAEQEYFNRNLTEADLEQMDVEGGPGSESVGYDEFLVFMLVAMGKVSPEDIQKMEELYQRLDADSEGALKVEDLFTMAYGEIKEL